MLTEHERDSWERALDELEQAKGKIEDLKYDLTFVETQRDSALANVMMPELRGMLAKLAAAECDCQEHYQRHPVAHPEETDPYLRTADPHACRQDWKRCWNQRELAIRALIQYAVKLAVPNEQKEAA